MKVLLAFGGPSSEHDVSINTAKELYKEINSNQHSVTLLYLDKNLNGEFSQTFDVLTKDKHHYKSLYSLLSEISKFDKVLIGMHGEFGEDGTFQSILESLKVPYTGSDSYSSKLCMDKYRTSLLVNNIPGILIPDTHFIKAISELEVLSDFPYIIKPNRMGSSVGVEIVQTTKELLRTATKLGKDFVVQKLISGVELSCGCLENNDGTFVRLPPVEIRPVKGNFFDYDSKYLTGGSEELVPPKSIDKSLTEKVSELSIEIHKLLGCKTYSRSDFIVVVKDIYYLETNTLPGLTSTSLLPKEVQHIGMTMKELVEFLLLN